MNIYDNFGYYAFIIFIIAFAGFLILSFVLVLPRSYSLAQQCLRYGYPDSNSDFFVTEGNRYCIKRLDQSDIVINLNDLKK